ncbi:DUF1840 domain-containing protein [Ideonella sp. YS5]|uniref:DUF1840 domain-containing protein n=1 Tax=Ideonella sp. YS5 TaxID=3453714 RepID=UPI003EEDE985
MSYVFKSKATADLLMLQAHGDQLLRLIGKEPAARGIIEPAAMPAAIRALEEAVVQDEASRAQAVAPTPDEDGSATGGDAVTLRQRAWPLLEMLKGAHAAAREIVWGV